jgi:hypothetical protein
VRAVVTPERIEAMDAVVIAAFGDRAAARSLAPADPGD